MKDPSLSNVSAPNMTISNEVILSSQFGSEDDPFAEYMWMENEEEFNRQVRPGAESTPDAQVNGGNAAVLRLLFKGKLRPQNGDVLIECQLKCQQKQAGDVRG